MRIPAGLAFGFAALVSAQMTGAPARRQPSAAPVEQRPAPASPHVGPKTLHPYDIAPHPPRRKSAWV